MTRRTVIASAAALGTAAVVGIVAVTQSPPVPVIWLSWNTTYTASNQVSVVVSSTNLLLPLTNWVKRFTGRTNFCALPRTNAQEFFTVYNITN